MAWEMLQDFKAAFHRCSEKPLAPYLKTFPAKPSELPKVVFDAAYSEGVPPVMAHPNDEKITEVAHKVVVCRSTSKKVAKAKAQKSAPANAQGSGQVAASKPGPAGNDFANFMANMQGMNPMQMMFSFMQAAQMAGNAMAGGKQPSPKKQKAVEDAAPVASSPRSSSCKQLALPAPCI